VIGRYRRLALGACGGLLYVAFIGGTERSAANPAALVLLVGLLATAGWLVVQRRRPMTPDGWAPAAAISYRTASARPAASGPRAAAALARVELRELSRSSALGLGLGLSGVALDTFGVAWGGDYGGDLPVVAEMTPLLTHPLAGMLVLASFRARSRARRDGTEELFDACPMRQSQRTAGHLATAAPTVLLGVAFAATLVLLVASQDATPFGAFGGRQVAAVVGSGILCLGAVCLGVALARWLPWTPVPIAAVVAVGFVTAYFATQTSRTTAPIRQLSTMLVDPEIDLRLTAPHWIAHHLWILSLAVIVGVIALLRDERRRGVAVVGALAIAAAVASGISATRPISDADAARIAALLDPAALTCDDVAGFGVCTFEGDDELRADLLGAVRTVSAFVPDGALAGWSVRATTDVRWRNLDPEVLPLARPPLRPDPKVLPVEFTAHPEALQALQIWTGLTATGSLDTWVRGTTLGIRGQARGAISLWLATRGLDADVQGLMTQVGNADDHSGNGIRPWPDSCYAGSPPVQWAVTDVAAARQMLSLPEDAVRRAINQDWDHLTAPETTTNELMAALGLDAVGSTRGITSGASEC
jgi:hypothetical protein